MQYVVTHLGNRNALFKSLAQAWVGEQSLLCNAFCGLEKFDQELNDLIAHISV